MSHSTKPRKMLVIDAVVCYCQCRRAPPFFEMLIWVGIKHILEYEHTLTL